MVAATNEDVTSVNDHHRGGPGHRRVHLVHALFPEVGVVGFLSIFVSHFCVVPWIQT